MKTEQMLSPAIWKEEKIAPNKVLDLVGKYEIHESDKQNPFKREQGHQGF